jgi:DNA topoisomerase-1
MPALRKGDEDRTLPAVKQGDRLSLVELTPAQHFTKPPARFSEASLVKELEKRGLAVRRPMRRSFRPFRIAATCGWKTVVSMRKKWVRSSPTVWKRTSAI